MENSKDRIQELLAQNRVTGVDFVRVDEINPVELEVNFLRHPGTLGIPLVGDLKAEQIIINSEFKSILPRIAVQDCTWIAKSAEKIWSADENGNFSKNLGSLFMYPEIAIHTFIFRRQIVVDPESKKLYWTNPGQKCIQQSDLNGKNIQTVIRTDNAPMGIALDASTKNLYWSEPGDQRIKCINLENSKVQVQINDCGTPMSLALDIRKKIKKIYWTDPGKGQILYANLTDLSKPPKAELLVKDLTTPFGIAIDPKSNTLYWTDPGAGCIQQIKGGFIKTLIKDLNLPLCITLDLKDKMYWTEPGTGEILRANLDGSGKRSIYNGSPAIPFGLCFDPGARRLYWTTISDKEVLQLRIQQPGDLSRYQIKIDDHRIDPYFNNIRFIFNAGRESDLDCRPHDLDCLPEETVDFPVNYLARDFWSFRQNLLDFAALRYPDWKDRLEADAGIMLVEAMSALADEMAYYQDRIGREAYLETATQRRSLRHHARLVDYHIHDGLGATAWIDVTVTVGQQVEIPDGTDVWAENNDGQRIDFEVGNRLKERIKSEKTPLTYLVDAQWNEFDPHIWDEDDCCLPAGATALHIVRKYKDESKPFDDLPFDDLPPGKTPGKWVLLQTNPANPAQPARAHLVRLISITHTVDPVFNTNITRLEWEKEQALPFDLDMNILKVRGNILPVSAGKTRTVYFMTGAASTAFSEIQWETLRQAGVRQAVERCGRDGTTMYLFSLPGSDEQPLVRLGKYPHDAEPELVLQEIQFINNDSGEMEEVAMKEDDKNWEPKKSLIGVNSSSPEDPHYTLEDGTWAPVVTYQRSGETFQFADYMSDKGISIRFGDGEFGRIPTENTVFKATYRLGGGRRSNVAAHTLVHLFPQPQYVETLSNPLPASGGLDAESPEEVRQLAPETFRAVTFRAVRPEDYAEAAERLPWVQRAGATRRWTGSWLTTFVTPDPYQAASLNEEQRMDMEHQLDRFRQCGQEAHVLNPVYADLDLIIDLRAKADVYRGDIKEKALEALFGKKGIHARPGYFSPDNFTFGTSLDRSTLEAAIQAVPGVYAIEQIQYSRRGWFPMKVLELIYNPGMDNIIRIANDPLHPEMGTVKIRIHGGL